ncbi:ABC transporter permease [Carnobacterium gallinarum]|uniref:ABC transporter permease n=1 Tax=Carnobacterium gallinarum TaxID=2749 RepID=UPI000558F043|nr:ABC transporter permease [Carnobacterium gallinarum]
MKFYKRAFLSITRRKGKSLILFAVIFILGNLIAGAISIQEATNNVENTIKKKLGSIATIELDLQKLQESEDMTKIPSLDEKKINAFGKRPEVKYYDYNIDKYVTSETITPYKPDSSDNKDAMVIGGVGGSEFKLKGVQYASILDFKEKKAKLIAGRTFTEEEIKNNRSSTLISKKLADANNLSVGDTFTMKNAVYDYSQRDTEAIASRDIQMEVIGIFDPLEAKKSDDSKEKKSLSSDFFNTDFQNTLYVPNEVAKSETEFERDSMRKAGLLSDNQSNETFITPTYVLKTPEDSQRFKSAVQAQIPKEYKVTSSSDQYNTIAAPIKSMSELSKYVLIAALGATILIIGLVVLLFLRDRKHEFGIYLSLGERRKHILGQILIEVMAVAIVAVSLSIFTGNLLASGLSESMIQSQIAADAEKEAASSNVGSTMVMLGGGDASRGGDVSQADVTKAYQVQLNQKYIGMIYLVSLSTILLSTIIPVTYIVRLNPKKIML